jgi:hypothetical protein
MHRHIENVNASVSIESIIKGLASEAATELCWSASVFKEGPFNWEWFGLETIEVHLYEGLGHILNHEDCWVGNASAVRRRLRRAICRLQRPLTEALNNQRVEEAAGLLETATNYAFRIGE